MDFSNIHIHDFLKASIPNRFQDVTPFDFEDFVAYLFTSAGYEVVQTDYTGDFGADLIMTTQGESTAVQVKRYQESSSVGAQDLNQIIGAQTFYKADHALIITTSKYTKAAEQLAASAGVELWGWDDLLEEISNVWLNGQDFYQYFAADIKEVVSDEINLTIHPIDFEVDANEKFHFLHYELENNGGENLKCQIELPLILTTGKKQIQAIQWVEGYFSEGIIYAGASVSVRCLFLSDQISSLDKGDRLIQRVFLMDQNAFMTMDQQLVDKPGSCFIVTHCYGKYSPQYGQMIYFREYILRRFKIGRKCIQMYYTLSPIWKKCVDRNPFFISMLTPIFKFLITVILFFTRQQKP